MDDLEVIQDAFNKYIKERKITNPTKEQYILFRDGFTIAIKIMMRDAINHLVNNS